ncbi:MAG: glycine cleavage T C-terminal barrel domain-containing protein, partial [Gammaproteobacteria bacterium]
LLSRLTDAPLDNVSLPFAQSQKISIAGVDLRVIRITYVGELGYELHVRVADAQRVYVAIAAAGTDLGLKNAGYRAIESLRLEKGYRAWGSDLTPDHTPLEAGLGWAVKLKSDTAFIGKEALQTQSKGTLKKQLACFTVNDPNVTLIGRETLYRNGERVGWLSSAGFGHTVGCPIGLGYVRHKDGVDTAFLTSGEYQLEVAGRQVPCHIHLESLYDPAHQRVKN